MAFTNPSIAEFKAYFSRDFPFGTDPEEDIVDSDIVKAYAQADFNINQDLFSNQANYNLGYLLLSAHCLTLNMRASSQGINGKFNFLENSKSVGSVSASYDIPQRILDNPYWAMFYTTNYGAQYLGILLPALTGQVFNAFGTTLPR